MNIQTQIEKIKDTPIKKPISPNASLIKPRRACGFQRPFSRDQMIAWVIEILSVTLFYSVALSFYFHSKEYQDPFNLMIMVILGLHFIILIIGIIHWIACETVDPAEKPTSWAGISLVGERWLKERYCAICRKTIIGLDHHCTWLHTCIGTRNYVQFFILTICGCLQFILQFSLGVCFLIVLPEAEIRLGKNFQLFSVLNILSLVISTIVMIAHGILLSFHIYLLFKGFGTYDWLLLRREKKTKKAPKPNDLCTDTISIMV